MKKCPACNSTKIEKFIDGDFIVIACSGCGYQNKEQTETTIK